VDTALTPPAEVLIEPWRKATLVAVGVAIVELALVIALAVTLLGSGDHARAATRPPAAVKHHRAVHHAKPALLPRGKTRVLILNGNGRAGAAGDEAQIVKSMNYRVAGVGNAARSYGRSTVLYPPNGQREAHRLAKDLGIALVGPLDGMSKAKLHGATVALILGR
jgi:hypothetical protein